ncbi:cohesin complex subunit SCC1 [Cryptosporidium felis]|nr:cohesin complex subunit SCC1 [Cryptosporidium felis]
MSFEKGSGAGNIPVGEFSILKYVKSEALVNLWLTAYFEKRIKKKQLMSIDINDSVKEIIKITSSEDEWIPLRISGGLLTGVVKVFYHKVEYLNNKCMTVFTRMQNFRRNVGRAEDGGPFGKNSSENLLDSNIDRAPSNTAGRGIIDIEEINKTLDFINDSAVEDQLEIVPLSQATEKNGEFDLDLRLENRDDTGQIDSVPILLDLEFDDFINFQDTEMATEGDVIVNEAGVEIDLGARVEKRRGESLNFEDILEKGLEESGSLKGERLKRYSGVDFELDTEVDPQEYRESINMYGNSPLADSNRNSIGGISATFEFLQASENRPSISADSDSFFDKEIISTIVNRERARPLATVRAPGSKQGLKRTKATEINQDIAIQSRPLEEGRVDPETAFSGNLFNISVENAIKAIRNSKLGILSVSRTLPTLINNRFFMNLSNRSIDKVCKKKRKILAGTKILDPPEFETVFSGSPRSKRIFSQIEGHPEDQEADEIPETFEFAVQEDGSEVRTPVRTRGLKSLENDRDELIFTPWTSYMSSKERGGCWKSPDVRIDNEKRLESLFLSREMKTMNYLNARFEENKSLSFEKLIEGSDASVVAPIFVQILHLKSKSMIEVEQKEPFGDIMIYPIAN